MVSTPKHVSKKTIFIYTSTCYYWNHHNKLELLSGKFIFHGIKNGAAVYSRENVCFSSEIHTFLFYSDNHWFMKTGCTSKNFLNKEYGNDSVRIKTEGDCRLGSFILPIIFEN